MGGRTEVAQRPPEKSHAGEGDCANCGHEGWLHFSGPGGLCVAATPGSGSSCDRRCRCPGWHPEAKEKPGGTHPDGSVCDE